MVADTEMHPWKTGEVLSWTNEEFKAAIFKKEQERKSWVSFPRLVWGVHHEGERFSFQRVTAHMLLFSLSLNILKDF